eukprot:c16210_g2_i1 orf=113-2155(+)
MTTRRVERDEDLALFHDMRRRDHERRNTAMRPVSDNTTTEAHLAARLGGSSLYRMATSGATATVYRARTSGEELLASDMGKNDYDWLLTPPGTPLVTGSENDPMADMAFISAQKGLPNLVRSLAAIKTSHLSRESSTRSDPAARTTRSSMHNSGSVPNRRSSLAPANSTPSSRPVSRPSTPTSRPIIPSSMTNSSSRSMTGSSTTRSGVSSRSTTPLRRPSTPVLSHAHSQPVASAGGRSSSASKVSSLPSRSTPASRGSSPTMRPSAWQPSTMPGFSLEPPPNLRTTVPVRSVSNSRGASISSSSRQTTATMTPVSTGSSRPGISSSSPSMGSSRPGTLSSPSRPSRPGTSLLSTGSSRPRSSSSSAVPSTSAIVCTSPSSTTSSKAANAMLDRSRRQSCSPSVTRGRTTTAERPLSRNGRADSSPGGDTVGRGNKMVDRMIQARRAAASSLSSEELPSLQIKRAVRPGTPTMKDCSVYGKTMSRKSIDIALRHMDIRQSASNGLRPLVSNMPSSSFYTVRSVNGRGVRPGHSPLTTSSTASSDHSMSIVRDLEGSEIGEDVCSEVGSRASPISVPDSMYSVVKEARVTNWMDSPDFSQDDSVELMQMFRKGIEKLGGSESPLVCHHHGGGGSAPCDLCNLKSRLQSLKASPMSADSMMLSSYYSGSSNGVPSPASSLH